MGRTTLEKHFQLQPCNSLDASRFSDEPTRRVANKGLTSARKSDSQTGEFCVNTLRPSPLTWQRFIRNLWRSDRVYRTEFCRRVKVKRPLERCMEPGRGQGVGEVWVSVRVRGDETRRLASRVRQWGWLDASDILCDAASESTEVRQRKLKIFQSVLLPSVPSSSPLLQTVGNLSMALRLSGRTRGNTPKTKITENYVITSC